LEGEKDEMNGESEKEMKQLKGVKVVSLVFRLFCSFLMRLSLDSGADRRGSGKRKQANG
jgi:hypothetical protein